MSATPRVRVVAAKPLELVVYDEPGACSYLSEQTWRLPLRLPVRVLTREEFGERLRAGDRRQGRLLYRASCPSCKACQPIRIDVGEFQQSGSQKRVSRRGDPRVDVSLGKINVDLQRVQLYNLHKHGRDLSAGERTTSVEAYRSFLGESCCETFEMRYTVADKLAGVAIVDRADDALSAVYFYWDPAMARLSLGTYSILKQIQLCKQLELRYLYLGLYIAECPAMSYKDAFLPHERLVDSSWERFAR